VLDPTFNFGETYLWILDELASAGYAGKLSLQCRLERVTEEFLDRVEQLDVCLEFGLQTVHDQELRAIGRSNRMDRVATAIAWMHDRGLHFEVDLMYGLPEQTVASFEESIAFCQRVGVPVLRLWPLQLLRGTRLDLRREHWGLRADRGDRAVVRESRSFSRADWETMDKRAGELRESYGVAHDAWMGSFRYPQVDVPLNLEIPPIEDSS